jgi:hypothetical protein
MYEILIRLWRNEQQKNWTAEINGDRNKTPAIISNLDKNPILLWKPTQKRRAGGAESTDPLRRPTSFARQASVIHS